jgi:hypothetical protein
MFGVRKCTPNMLPMASKRKASAGAESDVVVDKQPGGNVVTLSEEGPGGGEGEPEGGVLAGGVLGLLAGGPGDLQRIIAEQAIALAACKEALEAKTIEMRTKLQDAMDLVSTVREATLGGAANVAALLPSVGTFYTRRKDACSVCGSDNAVAYKLRTGTTSVVCRTACGVVSSRVKPEPILFQLSQADSAKQATFVFMFSRSSTMFVPPANLGQRRADLENFVEQYFAHLYAAAEGSPVFPGAGDVFLAPGFYVKLGPANTRLVGWEQVWQTPHSTVDFLSPRQMVSDMHTVLSSKPNAKAVILCNDAVDFGDCVHHFRDFLMSFSPDEQQRVHFVTRRAGGLFRTCATYAADDLLAALDGRHQFVNFPFHPTFFLMRMWEGMNTPLRPDFQDQQLTQRPPNQHRSRFGMDYSDHLLSDAGGQRSFFRMQ